MENQDASSTARRTRRVYTEEFKQRLIAELVTSGSTTRQVADRHSVNPNLLRRWQKERERSTVGLHRKSQERQNAFVPLEPTPSLAFQGEVTLPSISVTVGCTHAIKVEWPASQMNELVQFVRALQQ